MRNRVSSGAKQATKLDGTGEPLKAEQAGSRSKAQESRQQRPAISGTCGENRRLERLAPLAACDEFLKSNAKVRGYRTLTADNPRGKVWEEGTRRRCRTACYLLQRAVPGRSLAHIEQQDLVEFLGLLKRLPRHHHRDPDDHQRSLHEICERAARAGGDGTLNPADIGLTGSASNSHFIYIRMVHRWLERSISVAPIYWDDLLVSEHKRKSPKRPGFSKKQLRELFSHPFWTGRLHHGGAPVPGPHVFHDATYWVPLLCWYTGARVEELCGLRVQDFQTRKAICFLRLVHHEKRPLKNLVSEGDVPVHSELLRLGFAEYVEAIAAQGHRCLFPELLTPLAQRHANRLYSVCWKYLKRDLPWLQEGQAFHSFRHAANDALKRKEVFAEYRRELLGQAGGCEASDRYATKNSLKRMKKVVEKIPVVTDHLPAAPLTLVAPASSFGGAVSRGSKWPQPIAAPQRLSRPIAF
ncbi:MAG TPA: tyrosine-type recombinase/integrase [Allosphingosinicella sp.]|nr:tyrosine-type recombinase/integrase [Allosphingosinicella sp.]